MVPMKSKNVPIKNVTDAKEGSLRSNETRCLWALGFLFLWGPFEHHTRSCSAQVESLTFELTHDSSPMRGGGPFGVTRIRSQGCQDSCQISLPWAEKKNSGSFCARLAPPELGLREMPLDRKPAASGAGFSCLIAPELANIEKITTKLDLSQQKS